MLHTPSSSPLRAVLQTCTNAIRTPQQKSLFNLPTPPEEKENKRRSNAGSEQQRKRVKLSQKDNEVEDTESSDSESDTKMEVARYRTRSLNTFRTHFDFMATPGNTLRRPTPPTLFLLRSFVSSHKSDVFKCQSMDDNYLTPPYACSYSHGAKRGETPFLAVATEQGTVHVLDTTKRRDWDPEPVRKTLQPHNNGVFDVKWNTTDNLLATCSGDRSTRISCVERGISTHVLQGHTSTVKCVAWDPVHSELLVTGGRDGGICLWDLRIGKMSEDGMSIASPVMIIPGAHDELKGKPKPRKTKATPAPKSVTNILYPESEPYSIVSSSSSDGILRYWDLRTQSTSKSKVAKPKPPPCAYSSPLDPTILRGSLRPRGIISMTNGSGPTAGLIFALGADSRIHTYTLPSLTAQTVGYAHPNMQTSSFYVGLSLSPCGRWLACGNTGTKGSAFLFDVSNCAHPGASLQQQDGVELRGQTGEVGAVDWAQDMLATSADDGTIRVWRPDIDTYRHCQEYPDSLWEWSCSA